MRTVDSSLASAQEIRLRVGYHSAQSLIAEYTSRLAHRSCVLATRKAVDLGAVFVFEMYCPDHEAPVELEAEVVRARPIYGAALTYELAMRYRASRAGQAALADLLQRIEIDRSYVQVRAFPRIPVNLPADDAAGGDRRYLVRDVSRGGMLLESQRGDTPVERGAHVLLGARRVESEPLIFLSGTVRWHGGFPDGPAQIGIEFAAQSFSAAQLDLVNSLTRLERPVQLLVHLNERSAQASSSSGSSSLRAAIAGVVAAITRQELTVALGIGVLQGPTEWMGGEPSCLARVGFTGQLVGELTLRASFGLCAAIASQIAGDEVPTSDQPALVDGLREFLVSLGGSFCDRLEMQGLEVSLTEPLLGEEPPRYPGDQAYAFSMIGGRGSAEFGVLVRGGAATLQ